MAFFLVAKVVTVNALDVVPPATRTLAGTEASPVLELVSVTVTPPAGAAASSVTVPVDEIPPTTLVGLSNKVASAAAGCGLTVSVVVWVTPLYEAESVPTVVLDTAEVVMPKVALLAP